MKKSFLFKSLIDVFFFFQVIGLISILSKFLFAFMDVKNIDEPQFLEWVFFSISTICYFIFLRGLYFLRKLARIFLSQKYFTEPVAVYLKISGNHFFYAGLLIVLTLMLAKLLSLDFEPVSRLFGITPIFLMIVGLFFVIQSKTLVLAIGLKSENELTV